jgi:serine/threonine protein kinase/Tol biopolymer transport system component
VALTPGTRLGFYEIVSALGVGGMGEVYRARDTKLNRDVALKVLPASFAVDSDRLARFRREAQTLASLNHPNVAAIYAIDEVEGVQAIAMELVAGETLAERIARAKALGSALPLAECLAISRQIAEALDAAHERGIVHRDLKPANVIVTAEGVVKVLDFGLAKRVVDVETVNSTDATITAEVTRAGLILGTIAYMSPEQARGLLVDKRTDIWAFGCVLFELLAGVPPFVGATMSDTLAAVLERQPAFDLLPISTPVLLRRAVTRCLEKDPKRRTRDIADVAADLQGATEIGVAPAAAQRPPRVWRAIAAVAVLSALVLAVWMWRSGRPIEQPPRFSRIVRLTHGPAREFGPTISPDGSWVAYLSDVNGSVAVWLQFLSGGEPVNLTASSGLDIATTTGTSGLEVAPGGGRIAVVGKLHGSTGAFSTWDIPAPLPGLPHKLLDDGFMGLRWSPDGARVTFIRAGPSEGDSLWIADGDGTNRREIVPAGAGVHIHWPVWAADGFIYFNRMATQIGSLDRSEIYRVHSDGSGLEPFVRTLRRAMFPVGLPNGGLVYSANPTSAEMGLWWRSTSAGDPQRLTTGIGEYAEARVSADAGALVATLYELRQSLVRVPFAPAVRAAIEPITDGTAGDLDPSMMPTGDRLVFSSSRSGNRHIWSMRLDGMDLRPLTDGPSLDERPVASPDGTLVAFVSDRSGHPAVWVVPADGGAPRNVSALSPVSQLTWSRDNRSILFAALAGEKAGLWSVSVADGTATQIPTSGVVADPSWNPVRDVIAYLEPSKSGPANVRLVFISPDGTRLYPALPPAPAISAGFANGQVAWSPDGQTVAIVSQNTNLPAAVWTITPDDERSTYRKIVELPMGPRIRGISWTADGAALILGQHDWTSDVVLMDSSAR